MPTAVRYFRTDASASGTGATNTTSGGDHAYSNMSTAISNSATEFGDLTADPAAWVTSTAYNVGNYVLSDTNKIYVCTTGGTSGSTAPIGVGTDISDDVCVWDYVEASGSGFILHLVCTVAGIDTADNMAITGFTTSATNYIFIECQGAARNNGLSQEGSGTGYQNRAFGHTCSEDYVRFKGIEFCSDTANGQPMGVTAGATTDIRFDECLFAQVLDTANDGYLFTASGGGSISFTNCLFIGQNHRTIDARGENITFLHCGFAAGNASGPVIDGADGSTVTNCWSVLHSGTAPSGDWWSNGAPPNGDYNASEDTTAAIDYTNNVVSLTLANEFTNATIDPATADFTLISGNSLGVGTSSSTTVDITGATRTGTPDIGPFNFASSGTVVTVPTGPWR